MAELEYVGPLEAPSDDLTETEKAYASFAPQLLPAATRQRIAQRGIIGGARATARSEAGRMAYPGLGALTGGLVGGATLIGATAGPGIGAASGEALRQMVAGEEPRPMRVAGQGALAAAPVPALRTAGAAIRGLGRTLPGALASRMQEVIAGLRGAAAKLPRPISRETYEAITSRARDIYEAGQEALMGTATRAREIRAAAAGTRASRQLARGVEEARAVPGKLPTPEPDWAAVSRSEEVLQKLGGVEAAKIPLSKLAEKAGEVKNELLPLLKGWSGDPVLSESAGKLETFLTAKGAMTATEVHELISHIGTLVGAAKRTTGETLTKQGGALSQLYKAGLQDLTEAAKLPGSAAAQLLEAMAAYKRKIAVGTLGKAVETGVQRGAEGAAYSPAGLLKLLETPSVANLPKAAKQFVERLKSSLTPEEFTNVVTKLRELGTKRGAAGRMIREAREAVPLPTKMPFKARPYAEPPALQDVIEASIGKVQGTRGLEQVRGAPIVEALEEGSPVAKFLAERAPEALPKLREAARKALAARPFAAGTTTTEERMLPTLSTYAAGARGAPEYVLSTGITKALRDLMLRPGGQRLLAAMRASELGRGVGTRLTQAGLPALAGLIGQPREYDVTP